MGRTILVTGASGALGPHLLAELLRCEENEQIFTLLRPGPTWADRVQDLRDSVDALTGGSCSPSSFLERLHPITGDMTREDLGLDGRNRQRLSSEVDVVIHAAANTRFAASLNDLRDVNVDGTRRVLDLARRCARLRQFLLVSTTCVAGTRTGAIEECLDATPEAFVNRYERTKWEAERLTAA